MKHRRLSLLISSLLLSLPLHTQRTLQLVSYNVENLFDLEDDPQRQDEEFTPTGSHRWTPYRYRQKLHQLVHTLSHIGGAHWPSLVTLIEVENAQVIEDLLRTDGFGTQSGYRYIVSRGEDQRGINLALLYRPSDFRLLSSQQIDLRFPTDSSRRTRPLLLATGLVPSGDTLHLVSVHLPSRRGGAAVTDPLRYWACAQLRQLTERLIPPHCQHTHLVIQGDFNSDPSEKPLRMGLAALSLTDLGSDSPPPAQLVGFFPTGSPLDPLGSYCYQGAWSQLDQAYLSASLLRPESRLHYQSGSAHTLSPSHLSRWQANHRQWIPWRTWAGPYYQGGISDHYPITLSLLDSSDQETK